MRKSINITIVTPYFAPAWAYGGPPRVLFTLAKELIKRGNSVTVVTTNVHDESVNTKSLEIMNGIDIHRFPTISNNLAYIHKVFYVHNLLNKSKKYITKADFVLFSDTRSPLAIQIYPYLKELTIPFGIFPFGQIEYGTGPRSMLKRIMDNIWINDLFTHARLVFPQNFHERKLVQSHFSLSSERTPLVPLPIEQNTQQPSPGRFLKKFGLSKKDRILLFVGRFHFLKGIDILIRSVQPLIDEDSNIRLIIIGRDDGAESDLKRMIHPKYSPNIQIVGALYGDSIRDAYAAADIFVYTPRYFEETSTAALEALSLGTSVVTTEQAEIPYLHGTSFGTTVENSEPEIRNAIRENFDRIEKDKLEIQTQAQKFIQTYFQSDTVAEKLLHNIYHEIQK